MGHFGSMQWKVQTQHLLHFAQKDVSAFLSVYLEANKFVCKGSEKQTRHNTFLRGYLSVSSKCLQGHVQEEWCYSEFCLYSVQENTKGNWEDFRQSKKSKSKPLLRSNA